MSLQTKILRVLRSSDTQRIRFSFTGVTGITISINGSSFRRVAEAIESGDIRVVEDRDSISASRGSYSGGGASTGIGQSGTFRMGRMLDSSRDFDALVVHEAVHASMDLAHSVIPYIDSETAGYIAQGYYLRNSGYPVARMGNHLEGPYLGLMAANTIATGEDITFWLDAIHDYLRSDSLYKSWISGTFTGNG